MAANQIPAAIDELFTAGEDAADGANQHEVAIGIFHNKEAAIRTDLTDAQTKHTSYVTARSGKPALNTAVRVADSNSKSFIALVRDVLVPHLGDTWSEVWAATGFPDQSTQVPSTQAARQALLAALQTYFAANPAKENAALLVTAARAGILFTALSDARSALNNGLTNIGQLKDLRDPALEQLKKRLRDLIGELEQLLDDNDPRWLAFGFRPPGSIETPDTAEGLVVTPGTGGTALADWGDAALAARYYVDLQIVGVDADFRRVETVTQSVVTLIGLPASSTIRVRIISVNDAGEAPPSEVVEFVTPVNV